MEINNWCIQSRKMIQKEGIDAAPTEQACRGEAGDSNSTAGSLG